MNFASQIADPRDILLKITATTVYGSDLHLYNNTMLDMHDGDILGHEFMGIIEQIGDQVKNLKIGQRVVVAFNIDLCKREEYSVCGVPGGQAEYVRVPFADINCLPTPDDIPDNKALYLSDIIPTVYHGCEIGNVKENSTVAIWALGPIGLIEARCCIESINFQEFDTTKKLLEMIPGGVDCSLEAVSFDYTKSLLHKVERFLNLETDAGDILTEMITCTRKAGTISIIGVYNNSVNHFPIGPMMEKHLTITGGQSYTQKHWRFCLEKIRSGEMDPNFVISHNLTLN
ncbi:hypothetical protein I4U23_024678 [Adineta vaga]|nr:hypothetical protein I4U23_024678 [Adineta vaga]